MPCSSASVVHFEYVIAYVVHVYSSDPESDKVVRLSNLWKMR